MKGRESRLAYTLLQLVPGVGVLSAKQNCMDASFGAKDIRCGCCPVLTLGPFIFAQRQHLAVFPDSEPLGLSLLLLTVACSLS